VSSSERLMPVAAILRAISDPGSLLPRLNGDGGLEPLPEWQTRAVLKTLGTDHYVIFTEDRWTVEHSAECKLSGRMHECAYHEAVAHAAEFFKLGMLGRWRITGISEGLPDLERAGAQP
jgi:hypothetical protein